jgi:prepilin peptidase CpaA
MEAPLLSLLGVTLAVSALSDARARLIPDVVTWPAFALALGVRWVFEGLGDLDRGLISGVVAAAGVAALFGGIAWANRGFGWGDVKLLVVVGAALGVPQILVAVMFVAVVGAVQAVIVVLWQGTAGDTLGRMLRGPSNSSATRRHIPYGVAIAVGSAWAMWWGHAT